MARVVEICAGLGFEDVWTFANSGNVVFEGGASRAATEHQLERAFEASFGFEVTTFVRTEREMRAALALDPFDLADGDTYFITFVKVAPAAAVARALEAASNEFDTLVVDGREIHWRMRGKSTDTTLTHRTWNLLGENSSTSRNVNMLRRLTAKMSSA